MEHNSTKNNNDYVHKANGMVVQAQLVTSNTTDGPCGLQALVDFIGVDRAIQSSDKEHIYLLERPLETEVSKIDNLPIWQSNKYIRVPLPSWIVKLGKPRSPFEYQQFRVLSPYQFAQKYRLPIVNNNSSAGTNVSGTQPIAEAKEIQKYYNKHSPSIVVQAVQLVDTNNLGQLKQLVGTDRLIQNTNLDNSTTAVLVLNKPIQIDHTAHWWQQPSCKLVPLNHWVFKYSTGALGVLSPTEFNQTFSALVATAEQQPKVVAQLQLLPEYSTDICLIWFAENNNIPVVGYYSHLSEHWYQVHPNTQVDRDKIDISKLKVVKWRLLSDYDSK